ncbi:MAG: cobalamin biosynthesis protein CobQ [Pseudomonadota bacterium]
MNTPAHIIFAAAAFARPGQPRRNIAALSGAIAPDLSLYLMAAAALASGATPARVFNELYFSEAWQQVFAVDNSFLVWGAVALVGVALRSETLTVFALAALLHLGFDFPLHHDDGRPHFWPLSDWVFESPVSYWDPRAYGRIAGTIEVAACMALLVLLWRRFTGTAARWAIGVAGAALTGPAVLFGFMFS